MISYQNIYGQLLMVLSGVTESQYICINKALACPFSANYIGVVALSSHTKELIELCISSVISETVDHTDIIWELVNSQRSR